MYLRTKDGKPLPGGTLLGFVPGIYKQKSHHKYKENEIIRPNNLCFSINELIPYPNPHNQSIAELEEFWNNYK